MAYEIIQIKTKNPHRCLAIEEYLFDSLPDNCSRLLVYTNGPSVIYGKHQVSWKESNVRFLRDNGITAARRISGGGTVYHDCGNLNFSFITDRDSYKRAQILNYVSRALDSVGIDTQIRDELDIVTEQGKISGNAFCFRRGKALHHGTILVNADLSRMSSSLSGLGDAINTRAVNSRRSRVSNLASINAEVDVDKVTQALLNVYSEKVEEASAGSQSVFHRTIEEEDLVDNAVEELQKRNESWEWIFGRSPEFSLVCGSFGAITLTLSVQHGHISSEEGFSTIDGGLAADLIGQPLKACILSPILSRIADLPGVDLIPLADFIA